MEIASTDGVNLIVHDLGGEGAPLLVCHAAGFHGRTYGPLAASMRATRHVWALDFRAHGDSTSPTSGRFSWDGVTDDLLAVVGGLMEPPVDVFGHSMGGAVTLTAELRRPGTVRRAYLYEPIVVPGGPPRWAEGEHPLAVLSERRRATFPSRADALWRYAGRPPLGSLNAAALAAYVEHGFADEPDGSVRLKLSPAEEAAIFNGTGLATHGSVVGLDVPTRVAIGSTEDDSSPARYAAGLVAALGHAELRSLPHLGHFGPLEAPNEVAADALDWLSR